MVKITTDGFVVGQLKMRIARKKKMIVKNQKDLIDLEKMLAKYKDKRK